MNNYDHFNTRDLVKEYWTAVKYNYGLRRIDIKHELLNRAYHMSDKGSISAADENNLQRIVDIIRWEDQDDVESDIEMIRVRIGKYLADKLRVEWK